jgi:hypothetical protein
MFAHIPTWQCLTNWFRWRAPKKARKLRVQSNRDELISSDNPAANSAGAQSNTIPAMLKAFVGKPRHARPKELYAHLYWNTRIDSTYQKEAAKSRKRNEPLIKAVTKAVDTCWEEESEEFKEELKVELERLYKEQLCEWDGLVSKVDGIAIDPKERRR